MSDRRAERTWPVQFNNLGGRQAPRGAVDQKQLDVLAAHVAIIARD
jgi:hypothetical protein